ncbi:MAG TPA: DUF4956 domain-containing protein [Longimicrobiaceae bacterium]
MSQERSDNEGPEELEGNAPGLEEDPIPSLPRTRVRVPTGPFNWLRSSPFTQLVLYYIVLILAVWLVTSQVPSAREAFLTPVSLPAISGAESDAAFGGSAAAAPTSEAIAIRRAYQRTVATALAILGALALIVPVAGVYMRIKRLQYDPALVRSVVILPIVVAGIALVVKNSLALAFSLAGIVAAVRFRNTLKDPRDAVYIFLVIAIGLSAGVQALDVALVMSMIFNFVVLFLWHFNIGSIYGGRYGATGVLSTGSEELLIAQAPETRKEIRRSLLEEAVEMKTDGILLVHAERPEVARHTVQEALSDMARDWRLVRIAERDDGITTLEYLVRMKKKTSPTDLVGALDERWSAQVEAAEYIPFRVRERSRGGASSRKSEDD